jgi:catechol 2,3-dioxygenase-like lactoylglutathione lyase family enzyme
MLREMHAVLPAMDLARARKFYHDMLGMDPVEEHMEERLVTYEVDGAHFDIYETENAGTAKNTQLCFETDDLNAEMQRMRDLGVMFEEFEIPGYMKTENGVVTNSESMTAWFRDSEGNFICLSQRLTMGSGSMGGQTAGAERGATGGATMSGSMAGSAMGGEMAGSEMGGSMGSDTGSGSMGTDSTRM